ncbi:hypothetical protein GCM10023079_07340 [Streptomyces chitinivorans]
MPRGWLPFGVDLGWESPVYRGCAPDRPSHHPALRPPRSASGCILDRMFARTFWFTYGTGPAGCHGMPHAA